MNLASSDASLLHVEVMSTFESNGMGSHLLFPGYAPRSCPFFRAPPITGTGSRPQNKTIYKDLL